MATSDTLDRLQLELDSERRRNENVCVDREVWKERIRKLEVERDEMKELVEILIKKGACSMVILAYPRYLLRDLTSLSLLSAHNDKLNGPMVIIRIGLVPACIFHTPWVRSF